MPFNGFKDITLSLEYALKNKTLTSIECLNILDHFRGIKDIENYFKEYKEDYSSIDELVESLYYEDKLYKFLTSCFNEYGEIKDSASKELSQIRNKLKKLENELSSLIEKYKKIMHQDL